MELDQARCKRIFKVLFLSSHLLSSRHPVRKSNFGTCAVTGYCSFFLGLSIAKRSASACCLVSRKFSPRDTSRLRHRKLIDREGLRKSVQKLGKDKSWESLMITTNVTSRYTPEHSSHGSPPAS